ncbi:class I SAM-dependent methyltransferase [Candidatus Dojkabacteria bacterium]|nr:class I SAM-dependent methyltransferase [Candidatus Dojkabacteria bacterium]
MDLKTAKNLIKLNHVFYQTIGNFFDSSRNYAWPGWNRLVDRISQLAARKSERINILDLGCGNARFAEFLFNKLALRDFNYVGVEYSDCLIDRAKERIEKLQIENYKLINSELVIEDWEKYLSMKNYDLITLFAVMHHIPSIELREKLLKKVKSLMSENSLFVITFWKFKDIDRLRKRILDKSGVEFKSVLEKFNINENEFETEDYILDWERGGKAFRYCHYYSSKEAADLLAKTGFQVMDSFLDDGKERVVNEYFICKLK